MKIKTIEIKDMFSYYGINNIVFDVSNNEKNINIIYGRNGNGKTSFINCIKLLFLGTTNPLYTEQLRKSVSEGKTLSVNDYVIGNKNWYGILNYKAKKEGIDNFFIKIDFIENDKNFSIKREWKILNNDYDEICNISDKDGELELSRAEAEKFLHKRIPPDFVDFFFFDGEQIQQIAEANKSTRKDKIVKLLNISGIEFISKIIKKYKSDLQNKSYENNLQKQQIIQYKNDIESLQQKISLSEEKINRYKNDIDENLAEKEKYENRKKDIFINGNQTKANELNLKKVELDKKLLELKNTLPNILATSFLTFNSIMVKELIQNIVDEIKKIKELDNIEFANILIETLPKQLLEDAPKIEIPEEKKEQLKNKLERLLAVYKVGDQYFQDGNIYLKTLSHSQLIQLQNKLNIILENEKKHKNFTDIKEIIFNLKQIDFELKIINDDPEEQKELLKLESLISDIDKQIEIKNKFIYDEEQNLSDFNKKMYKSSFEMENLDKKANKNFHLEPQINLSTKIIDTLKEYKENLEKKLKTEVENYLNQNYKQLIDSNNLIQSIQISDNFDINYFDENNELIGMSSISAGMKQIVAISLLWALKETTNRIIPVIIDTPLGRIDYKNQTNILKNYYPKASNQVIILPTDSEINEDKFNFIESNVATVYELKNITGMETKIIKINDIKKEVFNG